MLIAPHAGRSWAGALSQSDFCRETVANPMVWCSSGSSLSESRFPISAWLVVEAASSIRRLRGPVTDASEHHVADTATTWLDAPMPASWRLLGNGQATIERSGMTKSHSTTAWRAFSSALV